MAISKGKTSVDFEYKKYYGVAPVKVLAVNPNKKELEGIYNTEFENSPEYVGTTTRDEKEIPQVRIDFVVKTVKDSCGVELLNKLSFFVCNSPRYNKDKSKMQIIDKYGRTAWATSEEVKNKTIPTYKNGAANIDKDYISVTWDKVGKLSVNNEIKGEYVDDLVDMVDIKKGLKVVIDCASGAGSEISPLVFRKAGCEVTTLNSQPDGFFPGRNPEPNEENLQTLMKTVVAIGADLGIAHDGDADRMITVDEKGNVSPFDSLLALISKEFDGDIVTTVDAGLCMDESVKGDVIRTPVGDVNVAEAIIEKDASFGGEPSGTWLHPDFCMCPDGILSGLRMAEIVSRDGKLSELLDSIPSYPNIREKITCSSEAKIKVMENMEELLTSAFDDIVEVNPLDGVRLTFADDSWVLVRPSGTEDYIRITLESRDAKRAEEIKDICAKIITGNL